MIERKTRKDRVKKIGNDENPRDERWTNYFWKKKVKTKHLENQWKKTLHGFNMHFKLRWRYTTPNSLFKAFSLRFCQLQKNKLSHFFCYDWLKHVHASDNQTVLPSRKLPVRFSISHSIIIISNFANDSWSKYVCIWFIAIRVDKTNSKDLGTQQNNIIQNYSIFSKYLAYILMRTEFQLLTVIVGRNSLYKQNSDMNWKKKKWNISKPGSFFCSFAFYKSHLKLDIIRNCDLLAQLFETIIIKLKL